jgi:hypothetical protein
MSISEADLITEFASGELKKRIFRYSGVGDRQVLRSLCTELHNAGRLNLLSLATHSQLESVDPREFFVGQHFFTEVIPNLKSSTREMMSAVKALVEKGGTDLAASEPNGAFRKWCAVDLTRAHEVVEAAKGDDPLASEVLAFALEAGNMVEEAIGFTSRCVDRRQLCGIAALGRMNYADQTSARRALAAIRETLDNTLDDPVYANALMSALAIATKSGLIESNEAISIVERICKAPGPSTQLFCAKAIWQYHESLTERQVVSLLGGLTSLDPSHKGTIRELDHGLRTLFSTPLARLSIDFATELLSSHEDSLELSDFESFSSYLLTESTEHFHAIFISWMLSGKQVLCSGISALLACTADAQKPMALRINDFNLTPSQQIFLCRKAIGYLFLQPVIAASVLVSVLRVCASDVAAVVGRLLFDPLLVNHGGALRDYL